MISVKDEFYHRHIIQFNLLAPVFELFRSMVPVGSNLISSAILEVSAKCAGDTDRWSAFSLWSNSQPF